MNAGRYTLDGSEALEALLDETCRAIGREVDRIVPAGMLEALALGGGYGRGEGGVLRTDDGDHPYNDLEFFLFIAGTPRLNERRFRSAIHDLEHRMTAKLGIDVEFKITSIDALASGQTTMFSYDLLAGHRIFAGNADALAGCGQHADASRIPIHEATRLMMNRCSGLLFAKERIGRNTFGASDADFVARIIAKAQLAMGDALLASRGVYHWSCRERNLRLGKIADVSLPLDQVRAFHQDGVEFKLHPVRSDATRESLGSLHQDVSATAWTIWKHIEEKRLGVALSSPGDYAKGTDKCPETNPLKNALIRLRAFGIRGWVGGSIFRYPRESLLNTLPLLLWAPEKADPIMLSRELVRPVSGWSEAVAAYEDLWSRYN